MKIAYRPPEISEKSLTYDITGKQIKPELIAQKYQAAGTYVSL